LSNFHIHRSRNSTHPRCALQRRPGGAAESV
jgi:hypothetical protein